MKTLEKIKTIRSNSKPIEPEKYWASEIGVFVFFISTEHNEENDVDILIDDSEAPFLIELN